MNKEEILSHFKEVKRSGNGYTCLCPAHNDHNPSCSITFNGEWANVHCFVGCSKDDILRNAKLKKGDLFMGERQYYQKSEDKSLWLPPVRYTYQDEVGNVLYTKCVSYSKKVIPKDTKPKKTCGYELPNGSKTLKGVKRVPYQLPLFKDANTIFVVEGEKCAKIVTEHGYVATTLDSGANSKWNDEYLQYFEGKEVIILPDNDEPGMKYARMFKKHIPWSVIKILPELEKSEDVYDWLKKGHSMEEIEDIEEYIPNKQAKTSEDKRNQSELLLELIENENIKVFTNDSNDPYVTIYVDSHREILPIESKDFSLWLQMLYYKKTGSTIRNDNLSQVINLLCFNARVQGGEKIRLFNRVAKQENDFWYDMTDKKFSAIRISVDGWSVVNIPPILFRRYRHQEPQVTPQHNGDINKLFEYVNVVKFKTLFLCWLVACFVPDIPHPMPVIYGEKGAAKSTACEFLKKLIDPSVMDTLSLSKDERTLMVTLQSHYYLPFDNVSTVTSEVSDILCRAITGGAVQHHKLYTNGEDYIFKFKRCLTINGISSVANRSDLLDRSIMLELQRVTGDKRREQREIYDSFERDRPYILGAIFDILSQAMKIYPTVKLNKLPRMADFCRWGYAIGEAMGGCGEEFLNEYRENQSFQNIEVVNSDMVAFLIIEFMRTKQEWKGLVSDLLKKIHEEAPKHGISTKSNMIPQYPNRLSQRIKGVKSNLEGLGISYEFDRTRSNGTYIRLQNNNFSSPSSPYCVDSNEILGNQDGDRNGDTAIISESSVATQIEDVCNNGDNGDGGDEFVNIEF